MNEETPLIPRTIYARRFDAVCFGVLSAVIAAICVPIAVMGGAEDPFLLFFFGMLALVCIATAFVNLKMARNNLPTITVGPDGIAFYSILLARRFRAWKDVGPFFLATRPGLYWAFSSVGSRVRQKVIVATDFTVQPSASQPPTGRNGGNNTEEIWISIRRFPMYEDAAALDAFVDELNAWRDRYGTPSTAGETAAAPPTQ